MTGRFAYRVPFGASLQEDGYTRFRFWAPDCSAVGLEIEGMSVLPMQPEPDGWFTAVAACGTGAKYKYRVRSDLAVPDPAARAQAQDVHDASLVVDPLAYAWQHEDWPGRPWHETVLYEVHPGLSGGFAGLMQRLPELVALGVTAVELMPIADFPGPRNWGYDGVLPFAPDRSYGTPADLKVLVDAAHGQGLMVFLDVVYNHFGPDGNYLNAYASSFFRRDTPTPWGPAIDFSRPQVRRFFIENALYWLIEYRFDGLRFDAVHAINAPGWLDELAAEVRRRIEPGRHVHLVLENDDNIASHMMHGFDAQWNDDGHHVLHALLTGEADGYYADYADNQASRLARCLGEGFVYQGEPSRHRGGKPRGQPSVQLPPTAFVLFLQNHDQIGNRALGERLSCLCPESALRAATALLLLSPQIPLIFMGDELGTTTPFLYFTSHSDALAAAVREGRRREFAGFPAFASAEARSRIPDPNAPSTFQSSIPKMTSNSQEWLAFYRHLLTIRHTEIVPRLAGARSIGSQAIGSKTVRAAWKLGDGAVLTIAANFDDEAVDCGLLDGRVLFSTAPDTSDRRAIGRLPRHSLAATLTAVAS